MTNLYPRTLALTPEHLQMQENARDRSLSLLLSALVSKPGVAYGLDVTLVDGQTVEVQPGLAVWPDSTGRLVPIEVVSPQRLSVVGEGPWVVSLTGDALVRTAPEVVYTNGLPDTVYSRQERWAYATPDTATNDVQVVNLGMWIGDVAEPGALILGEISRQGNNLSLKSKSAQRLLTQTAAPPRNITESRVRDLVTQALEEYQPPMPELPTTDELVGAVLEELDQRPIAQSVDTDALLAELEGRWAPPPLPQAYAINSVEWMAADHAAPHPITITLPQELPEHHAVTFTGQGSVSAVVGQSVIITPAVTDVPTTLQRWADSDPELRLGEVLAINGPQAGFYTSTVFPVRGQGGLQQRDADENLLWHHSLQRYTPGLSLPISTVDSVIVALPDGTPPAPMPLQLLSGSLLWGKRVQAFAVADAPNGDPNVNAPSKYVSGHRLIGADPEGIASARLKISVVGTLFVTPLAAPIETLEVTA